MTERNTAATRSMGTATWGFGDALDALHAESAQAGMGFLQESASAKRKLAAFLEGFSLEAGTHLHANDRRGLECLCRYGLRPPLAALRCRRGERAGARARHALDEALQAIKG